MLKTVNSVLLFLLIFLVSIVGLSHLWENYKFAKAHAGYESDMELLAVGAGDFVHLVDDGELYKGRTEASAEESIMKGYSKYLDLYIETYESNGKLAAQILEEEKYGEYDFVDGIHSDLEVIVGYEQKVGEDYKQMKVLLDYLVSVSTVIDNAKLIDYDRSLRQGFTDFDLLIGGYTEVVENLTLIVPPEYMQDYHSTMLGYYSELRKLFFNLRGITYEMEALRRSPDSYSDRVHNALLVRQEDNAQAFERLFHNNPYSADQEYLDGFILETFTEKNKYLLAASEDVYLDALQKVIEYVEKEG
ncbi:hypothetical protein GF389_04150 [Candidatus Dojkabacteria bacterium]|nr:hypothetical protein [Candidatus Dojkabacteria bacterium]